MTRRPPRSTLFPSATLFRSDMNQMTRRAFGVAGFTVLLVTSASFAQQQPPPVRDRESTRLDSSHSQTSNAGFCLKQNIKLADNARVSIAVKVPLSEVQVNSYV